MDSALDHQTARALLEWQVELGADEAMLDAPLDRYTLPEKQPGGRRSGASDSAPDAPVAAQAGPAAARPGAVAPPPEADPEAEARQAAGAAADLEALRAAMEGFAHCDLRHGAKRLVFADGDARADLMVVGEAPGRDEDRDGRPMVGAAGRFLDRMLAAIGRDRTAGTAEGGVYITNVIPWRPPQNREPTEAEIAMMRPFLERHVALVRPRVLLLVGNVACQAVLGRRGITRLRGQWHEGFSLPAMPLLHPAYLLRRPASKRETWADLLSVQARLREGGA